MAKPTAKADPLAGLTDVLRDLFSALSAPPPTMKASKKKAAPESEDEDEEDDDDEDEMPMPMPMPPMGKGMRRVTISILMPAKGKKSLPPK